MLSFAAAAVEFLSECFSVLKKHCKPKVAKPLYIKFLQCCNLEFAFSKYGCRFGSKRTDNALHYPNPPPLGEPRTCDSLLSQVLRGYQWQSRW